jgi:hypothetical protein
VSAAGEREGWVAAVEAVAADRGLTYEQVGGLNPRDAPAALCPGGSNRLTGELAPEFWGSSCDADEFESGGLFRKAVLPAAVLAKAHMPDLTKVVPAFDVESIESSPDEQLRRLSRLRVEFESIEFNRRFIATVPTGHDPIALRELFSPAFLTWTTSIDREVSFGASDRQLYFLWKLRDRTRPELERALDSAGNLFGRVRGEMEESGVATYPAGPWHAGMAPFPA